MPKDGSHNRPVYLVSRFFYLQRFWLAAYLVQISYMLNAAVSHKRE